VAFAKVLTMYQIYLNGFPPCTFSFSRIYSRTFFPIPNPHINLSPGESLPPKCSLSPLHTSLKNITQSMCAFQGKPVHLQWNSLWEGAIAHLFLSQHLTKIKNDYKIEDK
jgi:hypothetical protein